MKNRLSIIIFLLAAISCQAPIEYPSHNINLENIDIVRDAYGVPHIFGKTDAEVAYGFAWASCEDDFGTVQQTMLPMKGMSGLVNGEEGAIADVAVHLIEAKRIAAENYEADLSPKFRAYLEAFCAGMNDYAKAHPEEILLDEVFPVTGPEVTQAFIVGLTLLSGAQRDLGDILQEKLKLDKQPIPLGSNAFAISRNKTTDGKTYLNVNSHQPLEGPNSWYEAHLVSEEGLNMLGAGFIGSPVISVGTNENLGWAHTVNYADFTDIFQLEINPDDPMQYKLDGQWETLEEFDVEAKIKLFDLIPVGQTQEFYKSKFGVTIKTGQGAFAVNFAANKDIRVPEQWFKMMKSKNFAEFKSALEMNAIPTTNLVYADREDHIFFVSLGRFPKRSEKFDWSGVVPGNTSETILTDEIYSFAELPQVEDPASGYVYNCNHTPFLSSAAADNPVYENYPKSMGYQAPDKLTNRAVRFNHLIQQYDSLSYDDFKRIKYDVAYHSPMHSHQKLEGIYHLSPEKYTDIAESVTALTTWDRETNLESTEASLFLLALDYLTTNFDAKYLKEGDKLTDDVLADAVRDAEAHLNTHFGSIQVPLKDLQQHRRQDISLPVDGGRDVLAAMYATKDEDGRIVSKAGDSYIQLVRYSADTIEIESVNAYGAAAKEGHPHATDQMELYVSKKLKPMTLDKASIYAAAESIYHPGN